MKLENRVAVIIGAGQTPGETIGNGRAAALLYAREGARVILVDNRLESAEDTRSAIADEGGEARSFQADVRREDDCRGAIEFAQQTYGPIDILHYNVGRSQGDSEISALPAETWDDLMSLNLRGLYLTCKHALPSMRERGQGVITAISSAAAVASGSNMTYKTSKAGINALVQSLAIDNGRYGIRVNAIMPGLMDTPMAIERRARERGVERDVVRSERDRAVPLLRKMGTAWDVAHASLFLASDEAGYITGIALPVDGGITARVG